MSISRSGGFTLIEVTLSIVIGIILIAGATLLYNQAKWGAGATRAKAKVDALEGLVEEMTADSGGTLPTPAGLYALWVQRRPDDYAESPWGGAASTPTGGTFDRQGFDSYDWTGGYEPQGGTDPSQAGCVQYSIISGGASASAKDLSTGQYTRSLWHYCVESMGPDGSKFWYPVGS